MIDMEKPAITSPTQVLVHVHYAAIDTSVDAVLQKTMTGSFIHAKTNPLVLGWHFSGVVTETGASVKDLQVNDKVWGFLQYEPNQKQGSFAEYIVVDANECALQPKGNNVNIEQLTAASTEALTALQAMRDLGGLKAGSKVLVLGAGGGVGMAAVQIAKNLGAHVTAACSTKDVDRVKGLGADAVLDRSQIDPLSGSDGAKYDVIFDTPAKYSATKAMGMLNPKGAYVVTLPTLSLLLGMILSVFNGKKAKFIGCHSKRDDLDLVGKWIQEGRLKIDVDSTFPVKDLEQAIQRQNSKDKVGRVVIHVEGGWSQ